MPLLYHADLLFYRTTKRVGEAGKINNGTATPALIQNRTGRSKGDQTGVDKGSGSATGASRIVLLDLLLVVRCEAREATSISILTLCQNL